MTTKEWQSYIEENYGIEVDYPWIKHPEYSVCRHIENKKWFIVFMTIPKEKLRLKTKGQINIVNLKLNPIMIDMLKESEGFFPAYHMNKTSWISVSIDDSIEEAAIKNLIDISFNLTARKAKSRNNAAQNNFA